MNSTMVPNVRGVATPGRRTVYSMCGTCAVRCAMEVTVEDGKLTWLQGNPHDKAIGTSLCAKGAAGLDGWRKAKKLMQSPHRDIVVLLGGIFWWKVDAR